MRPVWTTLRCIGLLCLTTVLAAGCAGESGSAGPSSGSSAHSTSAGPRPLAAIAVPAVVGATGTTWPPGSAAQAARLAWVPAAMLKGLEEHLPARSRIATTRPGWSPAGYGPVLESSGGWIGQAQLELTTAGGRSDLTVAVSSSVAPVACPSHTSAPHDACTVTRSAKGSLVVDKGFADSATGTGASVWNIAWNGPDGAESWLTERSDTGHQALTAQQAQALLAGPEWDKVMEYLPAHCTTQIVVIRNPTVIQQQEGQRLGCVPSSVTLPGGGAEAPASPSN